MKKHVILSLLVLLVTVMLAGCGNNVGNNSSDDSEEVVEEEKEVKKERKKRDKKDKDDPKKPKDPENNDKPEDPEQPDEPEVTDVPKSERDLSLLEYNIISDEYTEVPVVFVSSSSQLDVDSDYYKYNANNLVDHDNSTAFVEGVDGEGIGEMVRFEFGYSSDASTYTVTKIVVHPGYQKSKETFDNNARPKQLEFHFSDGSVVEADLGDDYAETDEFSITFDPILVSDCTMIIKDTVSGKKYEDCCISEISFYSQDTDGIMYSERDIRSEGDEAKYTIEAYSEGNEYWSYDTDNPLTELTSGGAYITTKDGVVYVYNEGNIVALDGLTGETLWVNKKFGGYPSAWDFDEEGNLYLCGYYGPDLCVFDKDGKILLYKGTLVDNVCCWPSMLVVDDETDTVSIYYNHCDDVDGDYGVIFSCKIDK